MKSDKTKVLVRFGIKSIKIIEERISCPANQVSQIKSINFNIKVDHQIEEKDRSIAVIVEIIVKSNELNTIIASLTVACIYKIENFKSLIDKNTGKPIFPSEFKTVLNSISISTARGVMYSQFRGTFMNFNILPVIDPKNVKARIKAS